MELAVRGRLALFFDKDLNFHSIRNPLVVVEENKIVSVGQYDQIKSDLSGHDIIGDENQLIIPGLINCHSHLAMTLFRGIADDIPLKSWLEDHIWPLEDKLEGEDVYQGALLGSIESALAGVTTVNSMYWFPSSEAKAISDVGIRGMIAAPLITGITTLSDAIKIVDEHHDTHHNSIKVTLSLHSPYTVNITDFRDAHTYMLDYNNKNTTNIHIHTHLAESATEMKDSKEFNEKYELQFPDAQTPTEFLDSIGVLDSNLIAAHCIHVTEKDIQILMQKQTRVSINPLSNAKLGNHMPPIPQLISNLQSIGLGTDGPASNNTLDLFDTIRFLALYYKGFHHNPTLVSAQEAFKLATIGGSKALNWDGIGSLEEGSLADIVTINLRKPHLTPNFDDSFILNHFAYSMKGNDVENVIADGKLIVEKSQIKNIDTDNSLKNINQITQRLVSNNE